MYLIEKDMDRVTAVSPQRGRLGVYFCPFSIIITCYDAPQRPGWGTVF